VADEKIRVAAHRVIKLVDDAYLRGLIEIDEDISAKNNVEPAGPGIVFEIVVIVLYHPLYLVFYLIPVALTFEKTLEILFRNPGYP